MKKQINVILKENNKNQDPCKRIKKVARGYAFNYLIPMGIAEIATEGKLRHLNMISSAVSSNRDLVRTQSLVVKDIVEAINIINIRKKCSPSKLIFGSISEQDIADKILKSTGKKIDKKQIIIESIKKIGKYTANIKIGDSISAKVDLHILPRVI